MRREAAARIWNEVAEAPAKNSGSSRAASARATRLRLEAKMALYGHEITASINPFEADLGWIVKMDKGDFVGRAALEKVARAGHHAQAGRL